MEETILTAQDLKFRYDPENPAYALNGVSVGVQRGEFVAVLGQRLRQIHPRQALQRHPPA